MSVLPGDEAAFCLIKKTTVYENGYLRVVRGIARHALPILPQCDTAHAQQTITLTRECAAMRDSIGVLLFDIGQDSIVLIDQLRIGALLREESTDMREAIAGTCEDDEDILHCAFREIEEEAGIAAYAIEAIGTYYMCPGYSTEKMTLFCACVDSSAMPRHTGQRDENEYIRTHRYAVSDIDRILHTYTSPMHTVALLHWFVRNVERLRKQWHMYSESSTHTTHKTHAA